MTKFLLPVSLFFCPLYKLFHILESIKISVLKVKILKTYIGIHELILLKEMKENL